MGGGGGQISPSPIDFHRRPYNTLALPCERVIEFEQLLSKIKLTAAGCDGLPAWLLRSCSYELADIVAHILNCSFSTGKVPSYWLNALVTPVPKVSALIGFSDFRPISATPHLSRIAEKVIAACYTC